MTALHVEASGRGPNLVMLHGWAANLRVFDSLCADLQENYRIVRIDLPGHGRNDASSAAVHGLDAVVAQLRAAAPERAVWLGWSLGGQLALRMAQRHP